MGLAASPDSLDVIRSRIRSLLSRRLASGLYGDEQREYRELTDAEAALLADPSEHFDE